MKKITQPEKENLHKVLADNFINGKKVSQKEISAITGVSEALISYYKVKWGYARKHKSQYAKASISLSQAIQVCKQNGLRVTREKVTIEEL